MLANQRIFVQRCIIHTYSSTRKTKSAKITYTAGQSIPCRATFPSSTSNTNPEKTQAGERISARFMLKAGTTIKAKDLVEFDGVKYKVLHVHSPIGPDLNAHHVRVRAEAFV